MTKDWTMDEMSEVSTGDIVDTGSRICRVSAVTKRGDAITLHFKDGPPYEANSDNLIDIFK